MGTKKRCRVRSSGAYEPVPEDWGGSWYICFRVVDGRVIRDSGSCRTLEDAIECLQPAHVARGWMIRREAPGPAGRPYRLRVLEVHGRFSIRPALSVLGSSSRDRRLHDVRGGQR